MSDRLGTAQWEDQSVVSEKYATDNGKFWIGRSIDSVPLGYRDDRHICLVSGTRAGKGTSVIVNNLCLWPGSAFVVDPKGENATVTATRRGKGSDHCEGLGQAVHVLDPFDATDVDNDYRSCFNPIADLDPKRDETIDEASRLANAIVVVKDDSHEPFWDECARSMLRGLILHVLTVKQFTDDERNLITIRKLILSGAWEIAADMRSRGIEEIDPPHLLLWRAMEFNPAFDGVVAGIGTQFRSMMVSSPKTFQGVLQAVANHTEFLDSPGMRRVLAKSDFTLSELKTRPEGMTLYLSLPQRYMDTHYRWLRMMVALTTAEMEITRGQPATGHPVLMVLDEFAGLKRMAAIENAVAQIAGFGVKLLFVLQSLEQLKFTYKDNWETFLSNAGLKVFFNIDDHFTRDYISKLAGETEVVRDLHSSNKSESENESYAEAHSESETRSQSTTRGTSQSQARGTSTSQTRGTSQSSNRSRTNGVNQSHSDTETFGTNQSAGWSRGGSSSVSFGGKGGPTYSYGSSASASGSRGSSHSTSRGVTEGKSSSVSVGVTNGVNRSDTQGRSDTATTGTSHSETEGTSNTLGTSQTHTRGSGWTSGTGESESVHRRPLIQPDEIGRLFARVDDKNDPNYPGLAMVMVTGGNPFVVQRANYFEDARFIDTFSPHPDHEFVPAVPWKIGEQTRELLAVLEEHGVDGQPSTKGQPLAIAQWFVKPGDLIMPNQALASITRVPPDNRTVYIEATFPGKVISTAATPQNALHSGEYRIPDGPLFTIKAYLDTFEKNVEKSSLRQLYEAVDALTRFSKTYNRFPNQKPLERKFWQELAGVLIGVGFVLLVHFLHLFPWYFDACVGAVIGIGGLVGIARVVYGTLTKTKAGINFYRVSCPKCRAVMPRWNRAVTDKYEHKWGGWTCSTCGTKMDKWGRVRTANLASRGIAVTPRNVGIAVTIMFVVAFLFVELLVFFNDGHFFNPFRW